MRVIVWAAVLAASLGLGQDAPRPASTSPLMIWVIYPASDAIFYIETRTPKTDAEWIALAAQTDRLAESAAALATPRFARDQDRWMRDAKLLVDASRSAAA